MKIKRIILLTILVSFFVNSYSSNPYILTRNGVTINKSNEILNIEFVTSDIVRLRYGIDKIFSSENNNVCLPRNDEAIRFSTKLKKGILSLISDSLIVNVNLLNNSVSYFDKKSGKVLLKENVNPRDSKKVFIVKTIFDDKSKRIVKTADGEKEVKDILRRDTLGTSWRYRNHFEWSQKEALYGLGSHMADYMNLRGKTVYLIQHNLKVAVPVLNSTNGYGLLFDSGCGMKYEDNSNGSFIELEAAKQIDYYFMKGATMDKVVANYRFLTGKCPMMPKYLFGYIQSKERYKSSSELIDVVREYRKREIPLDMIVQDWSYWPKGMWGYMKMDNRFYPNPKNLADSLHFMNAHLMVSIWPNFGNSPEKEEFISKKLMLSYVYNAFNPEARKLYWKYANNEFFGNGFDAWWCDCSEPTDADWKKMPQNYGWNSYEQRWQSSLKALSDLLGAERVNLFSLYHAQGIYENQRAASSQKRVVNLTRSAYAGQQRYSTITWNGDTHASWKSFARQIPAGLNFMASGLPYWTFDIGAFFVKKQDKWFWNGDFEKGVEDLGYREFYTRMFQMGTFLPMFRSHGTDTPREVWRFGEPGTMFYESLVNSIKLRYRLLPYIYSLAGAITNNDYTMCRMLAFDFPNDNDALDVKDEFMFGPSLLICPVTEPMYYKENSEEINNSYKSRLVYLPKGTRWIDYWSGKIYKGGKLIKADAPISHIPIFVRSGAIIPMGPVVQYASAQNDKKFEIDIYTGKDADFTLYEDEGNNYNYEKGAFSTIDLKWNDKSKTLLISKRKGCYPGMKEKRAFTIKLFNEGDDTSKNVKDILYSGEVQEIAF